MPISLLLLLILSLPVLANQLHPLLSLENLVLRLILLLHAVLPLPSETLESDMETTVHLERKSAGALLKRIKRGKSKSKKTPKCFVFK